MKKSLWPYACLSFFIIIIFATAAIADENGFSGGAGTEENPYQVATAEDLNNMRHHLDAFFLQTADIDLGVSPWNDGEGWEAIGNENEAFTGSFDGDIYVVTNMLINRPETNHVGLFGFLGNGGKIERVRLEDVIITGKESVGGLVGTNHGKISQSCATGSVTGEWEVGGLVGHNFGAVSQSYATGNVAGEWYVGGLVGNHDNGNVSQSYAIGSVAGEFLHVGGLVGGSYTSTVSQSFWNTQSSGVQVSAGGIGLATLEMTTRSVYQNAGWGNTNWVMTEGEYPRLAWEGTGAEPFFESDPVPLPGDGTESNPYQIASADDFNLLGWYIDVYGSHIVLTADINFVGGELHPIGDLGHFNGIFDGQDHVIYNAVIDPPNHFSVGLFRVVGSQGEIRNLGIENITVIGRSHVGGLVGINYGTVSQSYATGSVVGEVDVGGLAGDNSGSVSLCYTTADVTGEYNNYRIGGLVGINCGTVSQSYATGSVIGESDVGGLAGHNSDTVTQSYATGSVTGQSSAGGLVGYNDGTVSQSYATGSVTGNYYAGGLVGGFLSGNISQSFWDVESSGLSVNAGGIGLTTVEMTTRSVYQNAGWGNTNWVMTEGEYPRLAWEGTGAEPFSEPDPVPLPGDGTAVNPYQVGSAEDFDLLDWYIDAYESHIVLTTDIDYGGTELHPIGGLGRFNGIFDGQDHVIYNAVIEPPNNFSVGLFRVVGYEGEIRNLGIENITVTGSNYVGGVVGINLGLVTQSYATGSVAGFGRAGGLVGGNEGTISQSYAAVCVAGVWSIGGLVGINYDYGTISRSYSAGNVTGEENVGGLVGFNTNSTYENVIDSFWNTDVGPDTSQGGTGKTTAEMMQQSTFTNWDFENTWAINEGKTYPYLQWQPLPVIDLHPNLFDWNGNLVADFGDRGMWYHDGASWNWMTNRGNVGQMVVWDGKLVVDFGADHGMHYYEGSSWNWMTNKGDVALMLPWDDGTEEKLVVDFGDGRRMYTYDGSWHWFNNKDAVADMTVWNNKLVVDFGNGRGFYNYDTSWHWMSNKDNVAMMLPWDDGINAKLVVDFGDGRRIYTYDGTWQWFNNKDDVNAMAVWNNKLVVDFGNSRGMYNYDGTWNWMTNKDDVTRFVPWNGGSGEKLAVDFGAGRGMHYYDGTWNWMKNTDDVPEMLAWGERIAVDFGSGIGIYNYDGSWNWMRNWSTRD